MCGDSSSVADVDRLLAGAKIHLVNTDPPYNVKVEPRSNNAIRAGLSSFASDPMTVHGGHRGLLNHQNFDVQRGAVKVHIEPATSASTRMLRGDSQSKAMNIKQMPGDSSRIMRPGPTMRPKDRPLSNDFISDESFEKMLMAWFGNMSRVLIPGGAFYIWWIR